MNDSAKTVVLKPGSVSLADLRHFTQARHGFDLDPGCRAAVDACAATTEGFIADGKVIYGVNTGFGKFERTHIEPDQLSELQTNLVLSHSVGTGDLLSDETVRLVLALKIIALARGHSGVRFATIEALQGLLEAEVYPCVPAQGSVGASGDLAPLAHITAALIGVGPVRSGGQTISAPEGLRKAGLEPLTLGPKEGVALINGTEVSTALALLALFAAEHAFAAAVVAGALTVEAARASHGPFDARTQELRGQKGQIDVAVLYRGLLSGSEIRQSHLDCEKVQDPYSLRCQPQVMGACLDNLRFVARTLEIEANSVSDSPLIFPDSGDVVSCGNFHAEPVALAADVLAIAVAEIGAMSERRTALLMDENMSGLPPFLVAKGGLNSGFMMAQVTAAALASENKSLAHPASVDSIPTSANQEDHVSMATFAARKSVEVVDNTACIVAIELLAAVQGLDFVRPLRTTQTLEKVVEAVRERVAHYDKDRYFAPDIAAAKDLVVAGYFYEYASSTLPSSGNL